jgi:hypothetical protein
VKLTTHYYLVPRSIMMELNPTDLSAGPTLPFTFNPLESACPMQHGVVSWVFTNLSKNILPPSSG